jgi:Ca2+-binding EF-hand superfamily protein
VETSVVQKLHEIFLYISQSQVNDGLIDADEFAMALGLPNNIISQRMFTLFNVTRTNSMNFREFAMAVALLSEKADISDKIKCTRSFSQEFKST